MISGKTSSGFAFTINEEELDDMEFVDALAEAEEDILQYSKVVKILLGESQRKSLYAHIKKVNNVKRANIELVAKEVSEILEASAETKNS